MLLVAAWVTAPWFLLAVGAGLRLVDVLLVSALAATVLGIRHASGTTTLFVPAPARRVALGLGLIIAGVLAGSLATARSVTPLLTDLGLGLGAILPLVVLLRVRASQPLLTRLSRAFVVGVVVSVAASMVLPSGRTSGRWQGLTGHPNQLGMTIAMAIPLTWYFLPMVRWGKVARFPTLLILAGGLERSGSRSGLLAAASVVVLMSIGGVRRTPGSILNARVLLPCLALLACFVVLLPETSSLSSRDSGNTAIVRVSGGGSAQGSDVVRERLLRDGLGAVLSWRGLVGSGYFFEKSPHNAFIETWAAGGLISLTGLVLLFGRVVSHAARGAVSHQAMRPSTVLALSVLAFAVAIGLNNALWARYGWVMIAAWTMALVAEAEQRRREAPERAPALQRPAPLLGRVVS